MLFEQFEKMHEISAEIRNRVNAWLLSHPAPEGVPSLKWAFSAFCENQIADEIARGGVPKEAADPSRFLVPKGDMLTEAKRRAELGEDAGAAFNEAMGKKNIKRARDAKSEPGQIRWAGDKKNGS